MRIFSTLRSFLIGAGISNGSHVYRSYSPGSRTEMVDTQGSVATGGVATVRLPTALGDAEDEVRRHKSEGYGLTKFQQRQNLNRLLAG